MVSLTVKLSKLDTFMDGIEAMENIEMSEIITYMRMYREHMHPNKTAADIDLVDFLDSLEGDSVPLNNGFVHFMRITDLNKKH
ncbi:MAG: hypothetical protein GY804_06570 [Alphaproteobacteria bacterium]|nr:hypothetical protein [Alphaproteobacteria bacterium]